MLKITVSGPPGSGTSTLVNGICEELGWTSLNGGDVFRSQAKKNGVSVEEFSKMCKSDLDVDRDLDSYLRSVMIGDKCPDVVESRLSGWWAKEEAIDVPRVYISTTLPARAKRLMKRDGGSYTMNYDNAQKRQKDDSHRYETLYGISLDDLSPYTHVIESDDLTEHQVLQAVLDVLEVQ